MKKPDIFHAHAIIDREIAILKARAAKPGEGIPAHIVFERLHRRILWFKLKHLLRNLIIIAIGLFVTYATVLILWNVLFN